jgi:hypothetical protein
MLTLENISDTDFSDITKLLDVTLPTDRQNAKEILELYGKYNDFCSILNFLNDTKRSHLKEFTFKIQTQVKQYFKSQPFYKNTDFNTLNQTLKVLKQSTKYPKIPNYKDIQRNDGIWMLQIDIRSANYTVLRLLSNNSLPKSWEEFLRQLVPSDIRSNSISNKEKGIAGMEYAIPDVFYRSKFFRLFCISDLQNNLRIIWETYNLTLVQQFCSLNLPNKLYVNSDEVCIQLDSSDQAEEIIKALALDPDIFKIEKYKLYRINDFIKSINISHEFEVKEYAAHYMIKILSDQRKYSLVHIESYDRPILTKLFNNYFLS